MSRKEILGAVAVPSAFLILISLTAWIQWKGGSLFVSPPLAADIFLWMWIPLSAITAATAAWAYWPRKDRQGPVPDLLKKIAVPFEDDLLSPMPRPAPVGRDPYREPGVPASRAEEAPETTEQALMRELERMEWQWDGDTDIPHFHAKKNGRKTFVLTPGHLKLLSTWMSGPLGGRELKLDEEWRKSLRERLLRELITEISVSERDRRTLEDALEIVRA